MSVTRRQFLRTTGLGVAAVGALGGCAPAIKGDFAPKTGKRVVVIGGGWGGSTAAKYVKLGDPSIEVILLEPNKQFISCPFSNLVLSGVRTLDSMTFDYGRLRGHGVRIIHEAATALENKLASEVTDPELAARVAEDLFAAAGTLRNFGNLAHVEIQGLFNNIPGAAGTIGSAYVARAKNGRAAGACQLTITIRVSGRRLVISMRK